MYSRGQVFGYCMVLDDYSETRMGVHGCVCVLRLACKHDISKTICVIYVICGIVIAHDPKMCPIVFGSDVMHINEGAGLNVKILKCSYFNNRMSVFFHIWYVYVVS